MDLTCTPSHVAVATYPAGATFGPRTLRDYEFVWIIEGEVEWTCDGVVHAAPPGTLILARPGMVDAFRWDPDRPTRHGFVHFTASGGEDLLGAPAAWPLLRTMSPRDIIPQLFRHLAWLQTQHGPHDVVLQALTLQQALVAFVTGASGTIADDHRDEHPVVARALAEVRRRWSDGPLIAIPVTALARAVGVSRGHLIQTFQDALGLGPAEAVRLLRLDRGATLLARSNLAIQDIAAAVGFANPFHFSKAFAKVYDASPRDFRKACQRGKPLPPAALVRVLRFDLVDWG